MTAFKPTDEQLACLDAFRSRERTAIEALAGSGKTTTLKMLARDGIGRGERILYTSFANRVIADAKASFPKDVKVATNHSLAWGVGRRYLEANRLGDGARRLTPRVLQQHFNWTSGAFGGLMSPEEGASAVMDALAKFLQSADDTITRAHASVPEGPDAPSGVKTRNQVAALVAERANQVWREIEDPSSSLPITHDCYLKLWALSKPKLNASVILLDEAQDTNPLMTNLLQAQSAQLVLVGDAFQQIYSFRGAVNAMRAFDVNHRCYLTQSFRFGQAVAEAANAVLAGHLKSEVRVRGNPSADSRIGTGGGRVILARTNGSLIGAVMSAQNERTADRIGVVGGVADLIKLVEGAEALQTGQRPKTPDLADFANWDEVCAYSKTVAGQDLKVLVSLVDQNGTRTLTASLEAIRGNEADEDRCDLLLSSAHKSKGREWTDVQILDDFQAPPTPGKKSQPGNKWTPEEANLLYVAVTRAKQVLDVEGCAAWMDAVERSGIDPAAAESRPVAASVAAAPADPLDALTPEARALVDAHAGAQGRAGGAPIPALVAALNAAAAALAATPHAATSLRSGGAPRRRAAAGPAL